MNILDNIVILVLSVSLWTGRKQLREEDLKLADGSELPPQKLASLGSKRVMDPAALAPFATFKRRAERTVLSVGTRFLSGYAVPVEKLDGLMAELDVIKGEYNAARVEFLSEYDQAVQDWKAQNPGWEEVIARAVESLEYVRGQLAFRVQTFNINPVEGHETGLETEINGLADQLRHEVRQQARLTWEGSFRGKLEVGQKTVRPIRAMLEKIEGLVFLEPGLNELVTGIRSTLTSLPKTGPIKGGDFAALCGVIHLLGNIPEAREIAENLPVEEEPVEEPIDESVEELEAIEEPNEIEVIPDLSYLPQFEEAPAEWF